MTEIKDKAKTKKEKVKSALPEVWAILRPRWLRIMAGLTLLFINRLAGLGVPYAPKLLLDRVLARKDVHFLLLLLIGLLFIAVVQGLTTYGLGQLMGKETQRVVAEMRRKVQAHISMLPISFYDANKTGVLVSRIMTDVEGVRSLVGAGFLEFTGAVFTAAFVFFILVRMSLSMTLVAISFLLVYAFCWKKALASLRPLSREKNVINADVTGRLIESLGGVRVIKGYHAEFREQKVFGMGIDKLLQNALCSISVGGRLNLVSSVVMGSLSAVILYLGARLILHNQMTPGDLFSYVMFMAYVSAPIIQLTALGPNIIEALVSIDRTREILAEHPEDPDPDRTLVLSHIEGTIRFEHVDFQYEAGKTVLSDISFEAHPGTVTALVGSSGSGKSTIVGLIAAFYKPTNGRVSIDGVNLDTVRLDSYRTALGVVLQESFLFAGTIRENVMFSRPDATEEEMLEACRIAHVDEFAEGFNDKYETVIGERGVKLSGGQRQRLSIARAILANPRLLLLDEATSSLDSESELFIQQGLNYLMKGRTTFVIAHRLSTIRRADEILVIEGGRIIERGTHESLYAQRGRYFDLYSKQHDLESDLLLDADEENELNVKAQHIGK